MAADVLLIRALDGWVAKGGAEGLFCAASADGLGIALKVSDGAFRAIAPALAHALSLLGVDAQGLGGERCGTAGASPSADSGSRHRALPEYQAG